MQTDATSLPTLAIGKTRILLIWKLVEYAGLALFIVIVPSVMGPDLYGRVAVLLSFIILLTMVTGLGGLPMFGRFIPQYEAQGEKSKTQALFVQLFWARALVAGLLSIVFLFLFPLILPEASPRTVLAGAGAFLFGALSVTCYQLFYGMNALGRWLSQEALTKLLFLILLISLGGMQSLEGAAFALLGTQLGFLLLGLFWTRSYFTLSSSAFNFSFLFSHLGFGLSFFAAGLLLMAVWRGGEVFVLLFSGQRAEVAFFNVANAVAIAFYGLISQLAAMIIPSVTTLHVFGEARKMNALLGYSLKYLTIASFSFLFVVHGLGSWAVEVTMGAQYFPVVANLKLLAFGLLPLGLISTGISMAMVHKQPGKVLRVTGGALVTFVLVSAVLIPHAGSYGASAAVALALGGAGVITYHQFPLAQVLAVARFWRLVFLGLIASGVLVLPLTPVSTGLLAVVLFISLLFSGNVISAREILKISQGLVTLRTSERADLVWKRNNQSSAWL